MVQLACHTTQGNKGVRSQLPELFAVHADFGAEHNLKGFLHPLVPVFCKDSTTPVTSVLSCQAT
jgi:hypothetical protein